MTSRQIANALGQLDLAAQDRAAADSRITSLLDQLQPRMIAGQIIVRHEIEKDLKAVKVRIDNARKMLESAARLERTYEADHAGQDVRDEARDNLAEMETDEP